jgi:hypothetical protein
MPRPFCFRLADLFLVPYRKLEALVEETGSEMPPGGQYYFN